MPTEINMTEAEAEHARTVDRAHAKRAEDAKRTAEEIAATSAAISAERSRIERSLVANACADRRAGLRDAEAAADATRTATINALNAQIKTAHDAAEEAKSQAARAAGQKQSALDLALAADIYAELVPHAAAYPNAPRVSASRIAAAWRAFAARASSELGEALHVSHLGMAFAVAGGFGDRFGAADAWHYDGGSKRAPFAADAASRAILSGAPDVVVDGCLRDLELGVGADAYKAPSDPERCAARRSRTSLSGGLGAMSAIDAARRAGQPNEPPTPPADVVAPPARSLGERLIDWAGGQ